MLSLGGDDAHGGSNDGALTAEDVALYRLGYLAISGSDREGSPVLIMDPSRRSTTSTARFRVAFYAFQLLSEYHTTQTQGLVCVTITQAQNLDKVSTRSLQMILKTFPIKFKAMHSIDCMEKNNVFVRGFVQGMIGIILRFFKPSKVHFYTSQSQQERERNVRILEEKHGLPRDLIPCSIGGTWKYEKFDEWLVQCVQQEKQLHLFDVHMNDRSCACASNSIYSFPLSAPNPTMWNESLGAGSRSAPIVEEHMIEDDSTSLIPTDMPMIPDNLQSLEKAMRHLNMHETKAFQDALQNAKPQIWEEECNPDLFLRVEKLDTRKAVECMAKYWQL